MSTNQLSAVQLLRSQVEEYQRVTWFLVEWAEREQRVALRRLFVWRWSSTWPWPSQSR